MKILDFRFFRKATVASKISFLIAVFSLMLVSYLWFLLVKINFEKEKYNTIIESAYKTFGIYEAQLDFMKKDIKYYVTCKKTSNNHLNEKKIEGLPVRMLYYINKDVDQKWKEAFASGYNKEIKNLKMKQGK